MIIVDGKAIAENIYQELAPKFQALGREVKLGIVIVGENPVIESFVRIKTRAAERLGVRMVRRDLPERSSESEIISTLKELALQTDAIIPQLPLPAGRQGFPEINVNNVLAAVPPEKDVDALNPEVAEEDRPVHAPVALAVVEILKRNNVEIKGARTVIVGAGRLVGAPSGWLLKKMGANVSFFTLEEGSIEDLKNADIIVSGIGKPGYIKPEHIREEAVIIDAGTSELKKKIAGDVEPSCAKKASVFSPVPGGVGPIAVAMIFRNLLSLIKK